MHKFKLTFVLILGSLLGWSQCNVINVSDEDYCGTDEANFEASVPTGACGFKWYNEIGQVVYRGCDFDLPIASCGPHVFYVEDTSVTVDNNLAAGYSMGVAPMLGAGLDNQWTANYFRTFFTNDYEMEFNSVTIEFEDRGFDCDGNKITIVVVEEDGTEHDFPVYVPCGPGVKHTEIVDLGLTLPPGNHEIKITGARNLVTYYNGGADYSAGGPLDYAEGLHITGNQQNENVYGGLFDWDVTMKNYCAREEVRAFSSCLPAEIAGNGIDDDCDGLVDCFDPDVSGSADCDGFYFGGEEPECMIIPDLEFNFDIKRAWQSTERVETRQTPVVGDLDGDGFPEVVTLFNQEGVIRVFDGRDGSLKTEISHTSSFAAEGAGIADVNGDGLGEIFAVDENGILRAYAHDGSPFPGFTPANLINGASNDVDNTAHPSFVDFNGDGNPEIYIGTEIFNAQTGALLAQSADPVNDPNGACGIGHKFPTAYDILPDGFCPDCSGAELITGSTVYSVNLVSGVLTPVSKIPTAITNDDGGAALADWNGDGFMDIVASGSCCGNGGMIAIWDPRTETMIASDGEGNPILNNPADASTANNATSQIQIADFDGDGFPEAAVATGGNHVVLDGDLTRTWEQPFDDVSGITASTSFDFEGDGQVEVVYRDENEIYIMDGATGAIRASFQCGSGTRTETPVIADVDADGEAEIICNCSDNDGEGRGYLTVFESDAYPWQATRKVWNQVNYTPVFVNDNLTIPRNIQDKASITGMDIYLAQTNIYTENNNILLPALPDLVITIDAITLADCDDLNSTVDLTICNEDFNAPVFDYDLSYYNENPLTGGTLIGTTHITNLNTVLTSDNCTAISIDVPTGNYDIYFVVNDDGSSPVDAPETTFLECDTTNNVDFDRVSSCEACLVTLQEVDSAICIGDSVVLDPFVLAASGIGTWSIDSMPAGAAGVNLNEGVDTVFNAESLSATPGTYKLMFTNVDGLSVCEDSIYITINPLPTVDLGADREICPDATAEIFDAGAFEEYSWYYEAAGDVQTYETNLAGNYAVEVVDANGCVDSDTVVLFHHIPPVVDLGLDQVICPGDSFEFDAGIFSAYSWFEFGSGNNQTFKAGDVGDYAVAIEDANGCKDSDTVALTHFVPPIVDLGKDRTICPGSPEELFDAGLFDSYSWYYDANGTNNDYSTALEGNYAVAIEDANGCSDSDTVAIIFYAGSEVDLGRDTTLCPGDSIEFNAGAFVNYSWYALAAGTNASFMAKTAGEYAVEVEDINGCVDSDTVALAFFAQPLVNLGNDRTICPGATNEVFDANAFAGYNWYLDAAGNTQTYETSLAGTFAVAIQDINGCVDSDTVVLNHFIPPVVDLGLDRTICPGDNDEIFDADAFAGYNWYIDATGNTQTYETNLAGSFAVEVTDFNGCVDSDTVVLSHHVLPIVNLGDDRPICPGDPNEIFDADAFTGYEWYLDAAGNTQTYETNLAGTYAVEVTDVNGCVDSDTVVLIHHAVPVVDLGGDRPICPGAPNEIFDGGAFDAYNWYLDAAGNTQTYETNLAGTFAIEVTNVEGCVDSDTVVLTIHAKPVVDLGPDQIICAGDAEVAFDAGAFDSWDWQMDAAGNLQEYRTDQEGEYAVVVKDAKGCSDSDTVKLTVIPLPIPSLTNPIVCPGMDHEFSVKDYKDDYGTYTYAWSTGAITDAITVNVADVYWVDVTNIHGCVGRAEGELIIDGDLDVIILSGDDINLCEGEDTLLTTNYKSADGYNFTWSDMGAGNVETMTTGPVSGRYEVRVDDGLGCEGTAEINVTINPLPVLVAGAAEFCEGENINIGLGMGAGYTYSWSTGETTEQINVDSDNLVSPFDIVVTNAATGCIAQTTYTVTENALPQVNVRDTTVCEGEEVTLSNTFNTAGMNHAWTGGLVTETINPGTSGTYTLTVTTLANCEATDNAEVTFITTPTVDLGEDITICEGEDYTFDAGNRGKDILWNTGDATSQVQGDSTFQFIVTVAQNGCETKDTVDLFAVAFPESEIDHSLSDEAVCFEDLDRGLVITANTNPVYTYQWNTGEETNSILVSEGGTYEVEISAGACSINDSIAIRDYCPWSLYLPNAFTPNGDNMNDEFPSAFYGDFVAYELLIFDRWGEQIFRTTDIYTGWNGKYNGNDCQIDVYVYKIKYRVQEEFGPSELITKVGRVSLIR